MQAARLRISQSQSTVELAQSAMGIQATAVAAQNRLRVTNKQFTWPSPSPLPVDKTAPGTSEYGRRRSDAEYRFMGRRPRPRRRRDWRKERPPGGDRRYRAGSRQQRGSALFRDAGNFSENQITQPTGGYRRLSVHAHEHRTARGVEDSVDVANAQAELLWRSSR